MSDWVVTVPKTVKWEAYQAELNAVADGTMELNYKVGYFPKKLEVGDRCFIVWDGRVRGWMSVTALMMIPRSWLCKTTGKLWEAGNYIRRSGPFHEVAGPEMVGFRGIRTYNPGYIP